MSLLLHDQQHQSTLGKHTNK